MALDDRKGEARRGFSQAKSEWLTKKEKDAATDRGRQKFLEERQNNSLPKPRLQPNNTAQLQSQLDGKREAELIRKEHADARSKKEQEFRDKRKVIRESEKDREK